MIRNLNDGRGREPYLRVDINAGTWDDLPGFSKGPRGKTEEILEAVKGAGFEGLQGVEGAEVTMCRRLGLGVTAGGRINEAREAEEMARQWKGEGYECATVHVGWGMEDDAGVDRLVGAVVEASGKHDFPIYIETHRATVTQDMWRTVQLARRIPEVRFNGDFSHWYTGLEMVYGGFESKLPFIQEVFERVRFVHGRIGNPGSMQVDIGDGMGRPYVGHFREMWTRAFAGFLRTAQAGDYIVFAPELLNSKIYYARLFKSAGGEMVEEGDRWEQAILYGRIARECFAEAREQLGRTS